MFCERVNAVEALPLLEQVRALFGGGTVPVETGDADGRAVLYYGGAPFDRVRLEACPLDGEPGQLLCLQRQEHFALHPENAYTAVGEPAFYASALHAVQAVKAAYAEMRDLRRPAARAA